MEKKIEEEQRFLRETEALIKELLSKSNSLKGCKQDAFTKAKINITVSRMFNQELDYLNDDPANYFDLYGTDHLKN